MRILRNLLRRGIDRQVYECLTLEVPRALELETPPCPGVQFRAVERAELARLSAAGGYGISTGFLRGISDRADLCFGAYAGDTLVSYVFLARDAPTAIDGHLRFQFPAGWLYVYKALTLPAWRGKRLLPFVLTNALRQLAASAQPLGFVTLVVAGNHASSQAFRRCGFRRVSAFPVWTLLARPWRIAAPASSGFSIGPGAPAAQAQV